MANVSVPSRVMLVGSWSRFRELVPGLSSLLCGDVLASSPSPLPEGLTLPCGQQFLQDGMRLLLSSTGFSARIQEEKIKLLGTQLTLFSSYLASIC